MHICIFIEVRFFFDMLLIIAHYNFIPRNKSRKKIPSTWNPVPFPPLLHSFNSFFPFPNRTIRAIDGYCSFLERSLRDKRAVVFERHRCTGLSSTELSIRPDIFLKRFWLSAKVSRKRQPKSTSAGDGIVKSHGSSDFILDGQIFAHEVSTIINSRIFLKNN